MTKKSEPQTVSPDQPQETKQQDTPPRKEQQWTPAKPGERAFRVPPKNKATPNIEVAGQNTSQRTTQPANEQKYVNQPNPTAQPKEAVNQSQNTTAQTNTRARSNADAALKPKKPETVVQEEQKQPSPNQQANTLAGQAAPTIMPPLPQTPTQQATPQTNTPTEPKQEEEKQPEQTTRKRRNALDASKIPKTEEQKQDTPTQQANTQTGQDAPTMPPLPQTPDKKQPAQAANDKKDVEQPNPTAQQKQEEEKRPQNTRPTNHTRRNPAQANIERKTPDNQPAWMTRQKNTTPQQAKPQQTTAQPTNEQKDVKQPNATTQAAPQQPLGQQKSAPSQAAQPPLKKPGSSLLTNLGVTAGLAVAAFVVGGGFPVGVALAGAIIAGGLAKTGYDSYRRSQAKKAQQSISAPNSPNSQSQGVTKEPAKGLSQERSKGQEFTPPNVDYSKAKPLMSQATPNKANQQQATTPQQPKPTQEAKPKGQGPSTEPKEMSPRTKEFVERMKATSGMDTAGSRKSAPPTTPVNQKVADKGKGAKGL